MSTTTNELPESAAAAVAEATRIAAQAARNSTETAKASFEATRSYVGETSVIGREMLEGLVHPERGGPQDGIRGTECRDRRRLEPVRSGPQGQSEGVEQFSEIVKRTQQATLESWQSAVKAASMATEAPKR